MPITPTLIPESPIFLVGEAPGKSEELMGRPFVGTSGQELDRMLADAGIDRNSCSLSNVFLDRPPNNDLKKWMVTKKEGGVGVPIDKGKYFPEFRERERFRLYSEIELVRPNIIVAMGNTALWALCGLTGIMASRGTVRPSPYLPHKVMAITHPAAICRSWEHRPVAVMDLIKAARESAFPEIRLPELTALIAPSLEEVIAAAARLASAKILSYDIETAAGQITCIGFAMKGFAICIPLSSAQQPDFSYWTSSEEVTVWKIIREILNNPVKKVTQNGLYDIQYLYKYGIKVKNSQEDTMLLHHSIMPELPKSLAFMGSVYTNYPSWKGMRPRGNESNKKEE